MKAWAARKAALFLCVSIPLRSEPNAGTRRLDAFCGLTPASLRKEGGGATGAQWIPRL